MSLWCGVRSSRLWPARQWRQSTQWTCRRRTQSVFTHSLHSLNRSFARSLARGSMSYIGRVKKRKKERKKVSHKQWYFTHVPIPPRSPIAPIFGSWGRVPDIVTYPKFHGDRFRGFAPRGRRKSYFSYTYRIGLYNRFGLPPNLWLRH